MAHPDFPLYIVSKGRWDFAIRLTSRALESMGIPYHIVVEEEQADQYRAVVSPSLATVLVLDRAYQRDYDTLDGLGDSKSKGPGPARNFVWDHAISQGARWHWVMDDNIRAFYRLNRHTIIKVLTGGFFRAMESFATRFTNVLMVGPQYEMFVPRKQKRAPINLNTRIYSCNLIRNDAPYRWRGRYNEDTILSLDMLKAGWCTVQFNCLLQQKVGTQRLGGGNTAEFYAREGTLPKSRMLVKVHPDVAELRWKFNRWHHFVDYSRFAHQLPLRDPAVVIPPEADEFGMLLASTEGGTSRALSDPLDSLSAVERRRLAGQLPPPTPRQE